MSLQRALVSIWLVAAGMTCAFAYPARAGCGEVLSVDGRGGARQPYSLSLPSTTVAMPVALVLLPGGGGFIDLGEDGCARKLVGNSLVRSVDLFRERGFAVALVDAPTDHRGVDGLGGFRLTPQHVSDLGKVIADVRKRTSMPVWLIGTSRGTISAVNAAANLRGAEAADGLVLTSAVTSGRAGGFKAWVEQTVFDVPLERITVPVLVVAHASDTCIRTPPGLAARIAVRVGAKRKQMVTVTGGPAAKGGPPTVEACTGGEAHGFVGQDVEVVDGITRFIHGQAY